ncbi:hypothetical protein [Thermogemmatispora tikiterensis]|uniref:hypothetical protein n=1 Tax=Thermogemmatispora tikiterensis TaxID=1825093 RepID=UPI0011BEA78E|nr:hypothetical protein [Thermogemmatispora tikiterensis]
MVDQSGQRRPGGYLRTWLLIDLVAIVPLTGLYPLTARAVAVSGGTGSYPGSLFLIYGLIALFFFWEWRGFYAIFNDLLYP